MKLYYFKDSLGNFGDDLNPWLWTKLIPEVFNDDESSIFLGIGTLINEKVPKEPLKIVFGSGVGYGNPPILDDKWKIYFVRGPLSAEALKISSSLAITDPGILIRTLTPQNQPKLYTAAFIPHHVSKIRAKVQEVNLEKICADTGIHYIDPSEEVEQVLHSIQSSEFIIAEAMHGAIVADAFRIPWIPVQIYSHILEFKWQDWCQSLNLEYTPNIWSSETANDTESSLANFLKTAAAKFSRELSAEEISEEKTHQILEQVQKLKADFKSSDVSKSGSKAKISVYQENNNQSKKISEEQDSWWYDIQLAIQDILSVIPKETSFIFVDENKLSLGENLNRRNIIPFLEKNGHYWGTPSSDEEAITELERLKKAGAGFLVFAWTSFWWLDYYAKFKDYLNSNFRCILENNRLVIFDLQT